MQVPTYERQAKQESLPNARQNISVDANNFLSGTEQAAIKYGESALSDMGTAANHVYAQQLHEARQTRILDAATQMQAHVQDTLYGPNGALSKRGADAFLGSDGKTVSDLAFDDVLKKQSAIADTLGDEQQKAEFKQHTNSMLMSMRGQLMGHEAEQHRVYTQSTLESSNAVQDNNIKLNNNNTDGIKTSIAQMKANSTQLAKLHGYDELWGATHAQSNISKALNGAIDAATANNDHNTALKLLHDFSPEMNQNDLLKNYQKINKAKGDADAVAAVTTTMNSMAGRFTPQDGDRLNNLRIAAESGGRQLDDNGQPITSPKGAIGISQMLLSTGPEAAKLAGLLWDENKFKYDQAYNKALGDAYFQKFMQDNHGDVALALASYNAGAGATQEAVKQAAKDGGNWLDYLPKETRVYVAEINSKYDAGAGKPQPPTLQEIQQQTLAQIPNATLDQRNTALQEVTRQYTVNQAAIKDYDDYNVGEALRQLHKNGGNLTALPQTLRKAIPPEMMQAISIAAVKIAKHEELQNPQEWAAFLTLPPEELVKMTPASFYANYRTFLDDAHLERGMAIINDKHSATAEPAHLEILSTTDRIKRAAQGAGILPEVGKAVSQDHANRFGQFEATVDQRVRDFESRSPGNRKASSEELQSIIDSTLLDKVFVDEWGTDPQRPLVALKDEEMNNAYVTVGKEDIKLASIPVAQRATIISKLQGRNLPVTENAIARLWVSANKPQ